MIRDVLFLLAGIPIALIVNLWLQPLVEKQLARRSSRATAAKSEQQKKEALLLSALRADHTVAVAYLMREGFSALCLVLVGASLVMGGLSLGVFRADELNQNAFATLSNFLSAGGQFLMLAGMLIIYASSTPFRRFVRASGALIERAIAGASDMIDPQN